jgi:hypothetical protein
VPNSGSSRARQSSLRGDKADQFWNGTAARDFAHTQPKHNDGTSWNVMGSFRPITGDFNGDGVTDVVWYRPGDQPDSIWFATSGNRFVDKPFTVNGFYERI